MMRRSIAHEIGYFDTDLVTGEDYDYWLRASQHCEIHKLAATLFVLSEHHRAASPQANPEEQRIRCYLPCRPALGPDLTRWNRGSKACYRGAPRKTGLQFRLSPLPSGVFPARASCFPDHPAARPLDWKAAAYLAASTARSLFDKR